MHTSDNAVVQEADRLYREYGEPLEAGHRGDFVAITRQGQVVVAETLLEALERATERYGPGSYVFQIGSASVGRIRRLLGVSSHDQVAFFVENDQVRLKATRPRGVVESTTGALQGDEPPLSAEQLREAAERAIAEAAVERQGR